MHRTRGGRFSGRKTIKTSKKKVCIEHNDKTSCCQVIARADCNGNTNYNQFLMHICILLSTVNDIERDGLDLNTVITSSEEIFKIKKSFNRNNFNFLEFQQGTKVSLVYKIDGLRKVAPYEPYEDVSFELASDENVLLNYFNDWFSMGYHQKSILQYKTHFFGIIVTENYLYLFDPNVQSPDGKHACELYKCDDLLNLIKAAVECINNKEQDSKIDKCKIIGIGTLTPLTSLELYVISNINYDKTRTTTASLAKIKNNSDEVLELLAGQKRLRGRNYTARIRGNQDGQKKLNETNREYATRKRQEKEDEEDKEWKIYMDNQNEKLNKLQKELNAAYNGDRSKLRDLTRERLKLRRQIQLDTETEKNRKQQREYDLITKKQILDRKIEENLKKKRDYMQNIRNNMTPQERDDYLKQQRELMRNKKKNMTPEELEEYLKDLRETTANHKKNMTPEEMEEYLKQQRELKTTKRNNMTPEEMEEYLKQQRELMTTKRNNMTDDEMLEYLDKQQELMANKRATMTDDEMLEYLDKQQELMSNKRKTMTAQEKEIQNFKSRQRYNKKKEDYNERNQLNASIRKYLKFKGKKLVIIQKLAAALDGDAESHIEAQQLININLEQRQHLLNLISNSLTSFVKTLKTCKIAYEKKDITTEKFLAMVGSSMHSSNTESYFVDSTYTPISNGVYSISEDGKIMDLFEPMRTNTNTILTKWKCNEMCNIDQKMVFERFHNIIQQILQSTPEELLDFIARMDDCPRTNLWDKLIEKSDTSVVLTENCHCDFCDPKDTLTAWEKLKYPNDSRIYVYCSRKNGIVNENITNVDEKVHIEKKMGHPHACYIHYPDNYGCISILLFLRCLAPHFPFIKNIVLTLYKLRRLITSFRLIDKSIAELDETELQKLCDQIREKAQQNYVPSEEWPYAHEDNIIRKYYGAFVSLKKKTLDLPIIPCISCLKLTPTSNVTHTDIFDPKTSAWDDLLDFHGDQYKYVCDSCKLKYRKKELPATSVLNNLQVITPPPCLTRLNDYEKMFIQRAKAFQVVTRMGTVSGKKGPSNHRIQKVKGKTFHLPLPLQKTLEKLPRPDQAINPNQDFYILVRAQPTKQKRVWQQFVNVKHVYEALQWLKTNNPLYQHIVLPRSPDALLDELEDIDVQFRLEDNATTDPEEAFVTQKDVDDTFYEHVTITSLGEERPNEEPSTIYQLKNVSAKPIDNREKDLDLLCYPDLYPEGVNGMRTSRAQPLTFGEFVKCKLMSVHSQFRLNIQYLFFLLNLVNMNQIASGVYTTMNTVSSVKNMTVGLLKAKLANKEFDMNACNIFTRLRNSSAFWNKPRNDINCMVRHYGPATWFLTFSPSEYDWDDLAQYLRDVNGNKANGKSASALIAMDPISTSRFIENKFQAMLKFICSEDGPIGNVEHYSWRREYQSRGLQHFHLMIWIKDAPILGKSSNEEVSEFIKKYASCHLPDSKNFPVLHSRVLKYQTHYHNSYCQRVKKTKRGKFIKVCRFGFSRPITPTFLMRDVATSIHARRKLKLKSRLYDLRRTAAEIDINDYNPAILMAWQGNTDIQFIGEKSCALTAYITKYTTKAEKSAVGDGFANIPASKPLYTKLWLMGQRILSTRECGALEAADTLLQLPLFGTDINTTIQWLDVRIERNRRFKQWADIQNMSDDNTNVFFASIIDTHYPKRPDELEDVCLYDFARKYDIVDKKPQTGISYKYGKKYIKLRKKPCLINHYDYNMDKNKEEYYHALLLLFKPFRSETTLLGAFKTYTESFDDCKDTLTDALQYHEKLQDIRRARAQLNDDLKDLQKDDDPEDASNSQNIVQCDPIDDNVPDVRACLNVADATIESVNEMISRLNVDQLRIFNNIQETLRDRKNEVPNTKVLRRFCSGLGGTGKSYLIKLIRAWVKVELNSEVIISAPTGIAAFNVGGLTIHRLLKLPVEHGSTPAYKPLSDKNLRQLRNVLKNVLLIIIDEVSMVSNLSLLYIHLRLQEIYNTFNVEDGWFGSQNLLLFGDLLQLSPVNSECPFVTLKAVDIIKHHQSLAVDTNLWVDLFSYDELTINVRQQSDTEYADILARIRMGFVGVNDEQAIRNRQITFTSEKKNYKECLQQVVSAYQSLPPDCLCLLSTKVQCNELNAAMLSLLPGDMTIINTNDKIEGRTKAQRTEALKYLRKLSADSSNTGGLEETLAIKIGCKVMLRRNIDAERGLVNGAVGIVLELNNDLTDTEVSTIKIRFSKEDYLLERMEVKFEVFSNVYVVRSQFPITLAYGITIHKSQSLSLESALIDIGNSVFCDGQTYVALSRLTSLEGLHIINFDARNVTANADAINEYNRLRCLYRPDLPQIEPVKNKSHSRRDTVWWEQKIVKDPAPAPVVQQSTFLLPGFRNPNNNCFANSSLQCLLNHRHINRSIMMSPGTTLQNITSSYNDPNGGLLDASTLITDVNYTLGEQQDASEFIHRVMELYPQLADLVRFNFKATTTCTTPNCGYTSSQIETMTQCTLNIPTSATMKALNIRDILHHTFKDRAVPTYRCDFCGEYNAIESLELLDTNNILIITLNVILSQIHIVPGQRPTVTYYKIPLKLNALPSTILQICGIQYQLKSAIFHIGESQTSGHYNAYIKCEDGWHFANDAHTTKTQWARGSKNAYILFYEKK